MKTRNRFRTAWDVLLRGSDSLISSPLRLQQETRVVDQPDPPSIVPGKLMVDKNVFITGAGKNIGRSTALEMAAQGANIFFTDIDKAALAKLGNELSKFQVISRSFFSDVSQRRDTDDVCAFLEKNRIPIDILVNNVGTQHTHATEIKTLETAEWHKTFDTNVFGPAYLTKLISQMMITNSTPGSIVFITSIHDRTIRRIPSYSASKAALGMIIKELAMELAPYGIRVNGIAPGGVQEDERGNPVECAHVPLNRSSIHPMYIGRAVVYLSSDYFSKFTTGSTLKIDAGATLHNHLSVQEMYEGKFNKR